MEFIIISIVSLLTEGSQGFRLYGVFLSLLIFHALMILSMTFLYISKSIYLETKNKNRTQEEDFKRFMDFFSINFAFLFLDFVIKTQLEDTNYKIDDMVIYLSVGYFLLAISKNLSILKK